MDALVNAAGVELYIVLVALAHARDDSIRSAVRRRSVLEALHDLAGVASALGHRRGAVCVVNRLEPPVRVGGPGGGEQSAGSGEQTHAGGSVASAFEYSR